jgi:hypothetical protein
MTNKNRRLKTGEIKATLPEFSHEQLDILISFVSDLLVEEYKRENNI